MSTEICMSMSGLHVQFAILLIDGALFFLSLNFT